MGGGGPSVEEAIKLLQNTSQTIGLRGGVKQHEIKRIKDAIQTLSSDSVPEQRKKWQDFLLRVNATSGKRMVILCVLALGSDRITRMKEKARLFLPPQIEEQISTLDCDTLKKLEQSLWSNGWVVSFITKVLR
jgi:hypothetical protein